MDQDAVDGSLQCEFGSWFVPLSKYEYIFEKVIAHSFIPSVRLFGWERIVPVAPAIFSLSLFPCTTLISYVFIIFI